MAEDGAQWHYFTAPPIRPTHGSQSGAQAGRRALKGEGIVAFQNRSYPGHGTDGEPEKGVANEWYSLALIGNFLGGLQSLPGTGAAEVAGAQTIQMKSLALLSSAYW
jgi:hypothetical protein